MGFDVTSRVTPELLRIAFRVAQQALRYAPHDDEALIDITARLYNVLADRRRDGLPIDDTVTATLAAYIASEWRKD
jgi:hypothetical protein